MCLVQYQQEPAVYVHVRQTKKTCFLQTISSLRLPLTFLDLNNSRESHIIPQVETFLKSTTRDSASA